jgi:hypothetical protein
MTTRRFHSIVAGLALALFQCWAGSAAAEAPRRVVSMNLCTDQLAMLIAAPGQLRSVSHLATDPSASAMAEEALDHDINHGLAEEIYLMRPDLVIAGSFSNRATLDMLRRLEIARRVRTGLRPRRGAGPDAPDGRGAGTTGPRRDADRRLRCKARRPVRRHRQAPRRSAILRQRLYLR